jgi:hypothetical protein
MDGQLRASADLTTTKRVARPHSVTGWVELGAGLHVWEQNLCSFQESNPVSVLILSSSKYAAVSKLLLKHLRQTFVKISPHITARQARPPWFVLFAASGEEWKCSGFWLWNSFFRLPNRVTAENSCALVNRIRRRGQLTRGSLQLWNCAGSLQHLQDPIRRHRQLTMGSLHLWNCAGSLQHLQVPIRSCGQLTMGSLQLWNCAGSLQHLQDPIRSRGQLTSGSLQLWNCAKSLQHLYDPRLGCCGRS